MIEGLVSAVVRGLVSGFIRHFQRHMRFGGEETIPRRQVGAAAEALLLLRLGGRPGIVRRRRELVGSKVEKNRQADLYQEMRVRG